MPESVLSDLVTLFQKGFGVGQAPCQSVLEHSELRPENRVLADDV